MGSEFYFEIFRMVSALALVLGILYILVHVARKTIWKSLSVSQGVSIRIVGQRALGPKKNLMVVEVDGRRMVLGVTAERISLLAQAEESEVPEQVLQSQESEVGARFFPRILSSLLSKETGARSK